MATVDVLSQLFEASWRGISFPTIAVEASAEQGVVIHRRMDRNGRRLENTGFLGYDFDYKIPFINTLVRGRNETWSNLYPTTYRRFLAALEDRTTGEFVHPDLGKRRCKVMNFRETLDPAFRGGPTLIVKWCEDTEGDEAIAIGQASAPQVAQAAAISLDATLAVFVPPLDTGLPVGIESLLDFLRFLGTIGDQADLARQQVEAKINRVISALSKLAGKYYGDTSVSAGFSDDLARLIAALHEQRRTMLRQDKSTSLYITPQPTTLAALGVRLKNSTTQLASLNPGLVTQLKVPAVTPVRYYS